MVTQGLQIIDATGLVEVIYIQVEYIYGVPDAIDLLWRVKAQTDGLMNIPLLGARSLGT